MKRITLGVIGHVDHGKTALVRALTGMETDRLPEEQRRGVSIALGFAHAQIGSPETGACEVDFIDMPGHERFVRTMVSGATGMQAALLVVAANEGIKPQTREHVDIAALLGVRRAVIAVTKSDLADPEPAAAAAAELAAHAGLEAEPPVAVSAVTGAGLEALRSAMARLGNEAAPVDDGFAWLPIDRAFTMSGHGLVVTGTLRRGRIAKGEALALQPLAKEVRVRSLQVHGRPVEAALPGQRVAVNLRGATLETAARGVSLAVPGPNAEAAVWLTVELAVPAGAPELKTGARLNLLVGTAEVPVRLRLLAGDTLAVGGRGFAQFHAAEPVVAPAGERFVLRLPSPPATVAGGRVLDPVARRLRRNDAAELAYLDRLAQADAAGRLTAAVERPGRAGAALSRLAQVSGLGPGRVVQMLKTQPVELARGDVAVRREVLQALCEDLLATLKTGASTTRALRLDLEAGPQVFEEAVLRLAAAGRLRVEGGTVRLVHAAQDHARALDEAALATRLAQALRSGGLSPPELVGDAAPRALKAALERLVREHVAVRTYDRVQKREVVFHREAVEAARRTLAPHLSGEGLKVTEAGAILGVSRKYSVPLLEHLDAIQFTRRNGDRRTLGPAASA